MLRAIACCGGTLTKHYWYWSTSLLRNKKLLIRQSRGRRPVTIRTRDDASKPSASRSLPPARESPNNERELLVKYCIIVDQTYPRQLGGSSCAMAWASRFLMCKVWQSLLFLAPLSNVPCKIYKICKISVRVAMAVLLRSRDHKACHGV